MSARSSRSQTLSFLMRRFDEAGIHPRTRLGQNFLIDLNLQQILVDTARLGPLDVVLEVGTGTGSLTALLAAPPRRSPTGWASTGLPPPADNQSWCPTPPSTWPPRSSPTCSRPTGRRGR